MTMNEKFQNLIVSLANQDYKGATVLGKYLKENNVSHPCIEFACLIGDICDNNIKNMSFKNLSSLVNSTSKSEMENIEKIVISPFCLWFFPNINVNKEQVGAGIKLVSCMVPDFSLSFSRKNLSFCADLLVSEKYHDNKKELRKNINCIISMNEKYRTNFVGFRIAEALRIFGLNAIHDKGELSIGNCKSDCERLFKLCLEFNADYLFLDMYELFRVYDQKKIWFKDLRSKLKSTKIVGFLGDAHGDLEEKVTKELGELFDILISYGLPGDYSSAHKYKVLRCIPPWHAGLEFYPAGKIDLNKTIFDGTINGHHWFRAVWLGALESEDIKINRIVNEDKGGTESDCLDHFFKYMKRLNEATVGINFSTVVTNEVRRGQIFSARSIEIVISGSLLISEYNENLRFFLKPGIHFFEFQTLGDLVNIFNFIKEFPEEAEKVRFNGWVHARQNLSDSVAIGKILKYNHFNRSPENISSCIENSST